MPGPFSNKHMIALYFTAEPRAAEDFLKEAEKWQKEEERERQHYEDMKHYVKSLSKTELQEQLLAAWMELEERRHYRSCALAKGHRFPIHWLFSEE